MGKPEYYAECLSESFAEHGVTATAEQIAAIAKDVAGAFENIGQAFYTPPASDQHNHEMRELKARHAREIKEADAAAQAYKLEACRIAKVDPHDVFIKDGEVWQYTGNRVNR